MGEGAGAGRREVVPGAPRDALIGREHDLDAVCRSLQVHRAVTLTGPGGVGKTALAMAAVQRAQAGTGTRAVVCELAERADEEAVRSAVAARLHVQLPAGIPLGTALPSPGDGSGLLVVLDNCEHVLDAAASVAVELLVAGPHVRVLATSLEPLRLAGERVHAVPPLAVPASAEDPDAARAPAVVLFAREAANARADFTLDVESLLDVLLICRRLDGMPLALKIAAARVSAFGPAEIAAQLDDRLALRSVSRSLPQRHRSIRAVVAWSYDLLTPAERTLFTVLALHPGGCDLAAAVEAGAGAGLTEPQVLDAIQDLVAKSLLTVVTSTHGIRYRMLETLRAFGLERLAAQGALAEARHRHADHYRALTRRIRDDGLRRWDIELTRLFTEFDNIRAAAAWTLAEDSTADRTFDLLSPLWYVGQQQRAQEIVTVTAQALARWPDPRHPRWSEVAGTAAESLATLGDLAGARERARQAVDAGSSLVGAAFGWCALATVSHYADRDLDTGFGCLHRASAAARAAGFATFECDLLVRRAQGLAQADRRHEALVTAEQALGVARGQGNLYTHTCAQLLLGLLHLSEQPGAAGEWLAAAEAQSRRIDYPYGRHAARRGLAAVTATRGELPAAAAQFAEALTGFLEAGFLSERWNTVGAALPVLAAAGRREAAAVLLVGLDAAAVTLSRLHAPGVDDVRRQLAAEITDPALAARGRALGPDRLLALARQELRELSRVPATAAPLPAFARESPPASPAARDQPADRNEVRRSGALWSVTFAGVTVHLPDSKGMRDLVTLLEHPGREVAALDLAAEPGGRPAAGGPVDSADAGLSSPGDLGERVDARARAEYAARIRVLQADLDEADAAGDGVRSARAQAELDFLARELAAAYGLHGPRRTGDPAERARSTVTARVRSLIKKVLHVHPQLGAHLSVSIRTGRFCSYRPERPTRWDVGR